MKKCLLLLLVLFLTNSGQMPEPELIEQIYPGGWEKDAVPDGDMGADTDTMEEDAKPGRGNESVPLLQGSYKGDTLQEDEEYFYLCGRSRITRVDKVTGEEKILWENPEAVEENGAFLYSGGCGLLIGEKLYFIEQWYEDDGSTGGGIACVDVNGSGYERLVELLNPNAGSMRVMDGVLYVGNWNREDSFRICEDGSLSQEIESGYILTHDGNWEMGCRNQETGEFVVVPELEGVADFNNGYFLCEQWGDDGYELVLVDIADIQKKYISGRADSVKESGELKRVICSYEDYFEILGMDEEYAYIVQHIYKGNDISYIYVRIALQTGEEEIIFEQHSPEGIYDPASLMEPVIEAGYIYYIEERDYKYYLVRREIAGGNTPGEAASAADAGGNSGESELFLGEPIYDSGISEVGTLQFYRDAIYSGKDPEILLHDIDLTWLVVDGSYPGAERINAVLEEYQNANIARAEDNAQDMEEAVMDNSFGISNSTQSAFSGFAYKDARYISFVQSEYEYWGGAHGMPYWVGFTFDLQTGDELFLPDIVDNSEEELKEIVTRYFEEMINQAPENFWDDAVDTVNETAGFESSFYLTEEGITFYYGPYDLACYAAGFQSVTIPYGEFDMKIELEKVK